MSPDVPLAAAIRWTRFSRVALRTPLIGVLSLISLATNVAAQSSPASAVYLGFDRNVYPGDESLPILRKHFAYSGYWLNNPPGRSEEHTSELQSHVNLVCRLLLEKKKKKRK